MEHKCPCGKFYSHPTGLYKHRKNCIVYIKQCKLAQVVEVQPVETIKHEDKLELQQQYYSELQEKYYKQLLEEKDKLLEEKVKLLEEKDKLLQEKDKLLEEKDKRIEDHKQTIEFMKTIAMRPAIMQPEVKPEVKPAKKHISTKEYLNSRNPITIDEFYDNYKPTIEEYDNIFSMGFVNAIVTNFANYAKSYKDRCPILFANTQYERLHVYVYKKDEPKKDKPKEDEPKDDEQKDNEPKDNEQLKEQWFDYERIDAHMYMKDKIIIRYVNKYQHYISVFNDKYKKCLDKPSNHEENNEDIAKKLSLTMAINTAENVSDRICKEIAHKLAINRETIEN